MPITLQTDGKVTVGEIDDVDIAVLLIISAPVLLLVCVLSVALWRSRRREQRRRDQ